MIGGLLTPGWKTSASPGATDNLDLRKIGQARNQLMDMKLNQVRLRFVFFEYSRI